MPIALQTIAKMLSLVFLSMTIAGCETTNHSLNALQFNQSVESLPENYRELAVHVVEGRTTDDRLAISQPATMVGETIFDPHRWFVCVSGIAPKDSPPRPGQLPLSSHLDQMLTGTLEAEQPYHVIVMYRQGHHPLTFEGYGARLCRNAVFTPLA